MKKILFLGISLLLGYTGTKAQIPEPVLKVNFNSYGILLSGSDAGKHTAGNKGSTVLYNANKNNYLGCTSNATNSYYWVKYDKDDALGSAFENECTWEFLFRLDKQEGFDNTTSGTGSATKHADKSTGTTKFFSSQQSGGWSFSNYSSRGMRLVYVTTADNSKVINSYTTDTAKLLTTGKFYHVVATVNKSAQKMNMYVNGVQVAKDCPVDANPYWHPYIGTTYRSKDMWFCLGGDPGTCKIDGGGSQDGKTPGTYCEGSAATTWVYANFYNKAISSTEAQSLYTEDVKWYTEPKKPAVSDLIVDAVFEPFGVARDASPYNMQLDKIGSPTTFYNSTLHRYEFYHGTDNTNSNVFYSYYGTTPSITSQMGDAFSLEFYAKAVGSRTVNNAPISSYQGGGWGNHINKANTNVPFTIRLYGYHPAGTNGTNSWGSGCKAWGTNCTASNALDTLNYAHYVCVFDRNNAVQRIYKNGTKVADGIEYLTNNYESLTPLDNLDFPVSHNQWFGIGGDANAINGSTAVPASCDFPWQGRIAIARIWGKALTEDDVTELNAQTTATRKAITTNAQGYATVCLPFAATLPTGLTAYIIKGQDATSVKLIKLAEAGETIDNGQPVILQGTASTEYTLTAPDLTKTALKRSKSLLDGSYIAKTVTAGQVYKLDGDQLVKCSAETLPANSAFLPYAEGGADAKTMSTSTLPDGTCLLDLSFTKDGIVNNGAEEHECKAYLYRNVNAASSLYDAQNDKYLGTTNGYSESYYYAKYNKNDELGTAFANQCTWEFLFRNDAIISNEKVFSSQDDGGWTFVNYNGSLTFCYIQENPANSAEPTNTQIGSEKIYNGRFYHVVVTLDKNTKTLTSYINGVKKKTATITDKAFQYPQCGTEARENDMWLCLGGDPTNNRTPVACQSPGRCTYVFARIYKGVKDDDAVKALYTNDVKKYTEPTLPNTEDLLLDAQFNKTGVKDASIWDNLNTRGTITTTLNTDKTRYVGNFNGTNTNFAYSNYSDKLMYGKLMNDAVSAEVYVKPTISSTSTITPISTQESGGFALEFLKDKTYKCNINTFSYNSTTEKFDAGTTTILGTEELSNDYVHMVLVYDRVNRCKKLYKNGILINTISDLLATNQFKFPFARHQWICIGGDTNASLSYKCDYPFQGEIAIARVWSKALTDNDVTALSAQASATSQDVTIDEYKYITRIFPFAAVVPAGVKAYVVSSANGKAYLTEYAAEGDVIPYGTPVILGSETQGTYTINAADLSTATVKDAPATNLLEGSFASKHVAADGDYYILAEDGGQLVFAKAQGNTDITAQRAWLPKGKITLSSASKGLAIVAPGITSVNGVQTSADAKNIYYDIQGRKVKNPTRGLYIKNGQKIWVK